MWPFRHKTLEEMRADTAKGDGTCSQRIYFGDGFVSCMEYPVGESSYCLAHQPGATAKAMGVFERLPPPPEPIVKIRENIDASGTDEWSDGRFRNRRGRYTQGGRQLKMDEKSVYNRRRQREYRAKKRAERHAMQRQEAVEGAACPHCRQLHDEGTAHSVR